MKRSARPEIINRRLKDPIDVLWCGNLSHKRGPGWSFPPQVDKFLREQFDGKSVLHLFGGRASFGTRLDVDASTRPDVIGDAWVAPFAKNSFDVVILDPPYPPYLQMNSNVAIPLLQTATWISRELVVWFHPLWISGYTFLRLRHSYFVRVADYAEIRCLQFLKPVAPKKFGPPTRFTKGPAVKYNRWLLGNRLLPFGTGTESGDGELIS
jgi:hypothetical protein